MGKVYESITDEIREFITRQHLFFVGTAPLSAEGHINLSPKGMDCFRVLGANEVAYLDMTGSGNETSAHLHENGRVTFMFCAFEGAPNILRLYGEGRTVLPTDPDWADYARHFTLYTGTRQIITADIHRLQTSCGFAVPIYEYKRERDTLVRYWEQKSGTLGEYHAEKNVCSIDGLPTPIGEAVSHQPSEASAD